MSKKIECVICGGETEIRFVSCNFKRFGQEFTYDNIKADVCQKCGERFLDGPTITKIEREIRERVFEKAA